MTSDRTRLIGALATLATALYLIAVAPGFRYRRAARRIAIAVYGLACAAVAVLVVMWLLGIDG